MNALLPSRPRSWPRKVIAGFVGLLLANLLPTIAASAATPELPKASVWRGKYPFDLKPGFYETAGLRKEAGALIGAKRYKEVMLGWSVAAPIAADGDALLAWGCKPHDCGDNHQSTLIDGGAVAICIAQGGTATWYATSLPKPAAPRVSGAKNGGCQFETVQQARESLASAR